MFNFPYLPSPFPYYKRYGYNNYTKNNTYENINTKYHQNIDSKKTEPKNTNDTFLFDLFGIKLYFDDILLLCLIFFLYNEGVKDEGLFFALILLLLT